MKKYLDNFLNKKIYFCYILKISSGNLNKKNGIIN
jgi:hypothetical protein